MKFKSNIKRAFGKLSEIKRIPLHLLLLLSFFIPIFLILSIDVLNMEAFVQFNQKFMFDYTWKGRMFYLFFVWLVLVESILGWENIIEKQRAFRNRFRVILTCVFGGIPTIYILSVNFLGLSQVILNLGKVLQFRDYAEVYWPLTLEYLIFASFFLFATFLAYGFRGLKSLSISLSFLAGISVMYLVDTIWTFGTLKPLELLAVPTAAFATVLLDLLGYSATFYYPASLSEYGSLPQMIVSKGGGTVSAAIAWPCAGVHSMLLFTLIILVFFKKTTIERDRKIIFFLLGAAGTYLVNIFRIASFFTIAISYGMDAAWAFHDSYAELFFMSWMFLFFIVVIAIQSGKINRFAQSLRKRVKGNKA